jgi:hypothetical protein
MVFRFDVRLWMNGSEKLISRCVVVGFVVLSSMDNMMMIGSIRVKAIITMLEGADRIVDPIMCR